MAIHTFSFPTTIRFGAGARRLVGDELKTAGVKRVLIVTDRALAELPICKEFVAELKQSLRDVRLFSGVFGNPVEAQVIAGVNELHQHGADGIVGFGGGAAIDVAKAIAVMAEHPGRIFDYEDGKPNAAPIDRHLPHFVAVPTTSGTGSEVGRSTVISDERTHVKRIVFSPRLLAKMVFADPELTLDLPAPITAATGMDALTHCVEAYLAKDYHPICDGIALEGMRLAARSLARCVSTPKDLGARGDMMMASMMGAIAFQKGLGVTHSCAHALSAIADLHHGLANGIMIDYALSHNLSGCEERFATMATTVGLPAANGAAFIAWLKRLKKEIGIPATLSAKPVDLRARLDDLVAGALHDGCHQSNPVACGADDFRRIFSAAM
jgi:alcohol dehydrogenase class IV